MDMGKSTLSFMRIYSKGFMPSSPKINNTV